MKKYIFEVIVLEGNDEFWEAIGNKSGCDEIFDEVESALADHGFTSPETTVRLLRFQDDTQP